MSLLPSPRLRPQEQTPDPARTLDMLATILMTGIAICVLYFAREILVPIAIALILSFVLSPPIRLLRKIGVGRTLSVLIVVAATFFGALGVGAIIARQISELVADAPRYQQTVTAKIDRAREFAARNPLIDKVNVMIADVSQNQTGAKKAEDAKAAQAARPRGEASGAQAKGATTAASALAHRGGDTPVPVQIVSPPPGVLTIIQSVAGSAASPLATAAFVSIFIVFMLLQREDLRNRFIRLMGAHDLQRTTLALTDAARRLSRYFLAQVLLNTGFGIVVGVALALLGVPGAGLWGIVAILMRFIPYIGSIGAALFPMIFAAASSDGWAMLFETALLFVVTEFLTGQVIEPLVYGRNTGLSPIAVVVSATFWTWLWGPVGLVLATPLTVFLVVMARHVDRLSFFDVLLGDAPPLTEVESFYQRMLAGDPSEIVEHAESFLTDHSLVDYCDRVAMRALLMAQADVRRGALDESRQVRIRDSMREIAEDLLDRDDAGMAARRGPSDDQVPASIADEDEIAAAAAERARTDTDAGLPHPPIADAWRRDGAVVCIAGRTPLDEAAAHLLCDLLRERGIGAGVEPALSLADNTLARLDTGAVQLLVLSFLDVDVSPAQARFAVRRVRRHCPKVPVVAAFWLPEEDEARTASLCAGARCDTCVSTLPEAIRVCLDRAAAEPRLEAA